MRDCSPETFPRWTSPLAARPLGLARFADLPLCPTDLCLGAQRSFFPQSPILCHRHQERRVYDGTECEARRGGSHRNYTRANDPDRTCLLTHLCLSMGTARRWRLGRENRRPHTPESCLPFAW